MMERLLRAFREHPAEAGETYVAHLAFTLGLGFRFFLLAVVSVVHGLFPFLLCRTASAQCAKMMETFEKRGRP
jgi:hypothetical protein